jgi:AcrR family transcriptional regulator
VVKPAGREENRRRVLTRDRVVAEVLAIISASGAAALSMRTLATCLGVVPAALYRYVRSKEQPYDLVLVGVLAEVDCQAEPALSWAGQVTALARTGYGPSSKITGIAARLKPAAPSAPTPSPWPRPSSRRCKPLACPPARPPWPSG